MDQTAEEKFLKTARERFKYCVEREQNNRASALEAIKFRNLEQWPDNIKNAREKDVTGARPCLTIDKVNQYVRQVCNDQRQNRPQIKIRPNDDISDPETAEVFNGVIRNILAQSHADIAFDTAFEHAADGGYGYFRVLTEYIDENSFDQTIKVERIRNRFSVYLGEHQQPDGSDAEYGFIVDRISKEEYQRLYPQADKSKSEWEEAGRGDESDWYEDEFMRIAEYFYTEHTKVPKYLLEDGSVVTKEEYETSLNQALYKPDLNLGMIKMDILKERTVNQKRIKWCKLTGMRVLEKSDWAGKWIPVIKVTGVELDIEGRLYLSGMVQPAMDACRMYNYAASAFVEMVALAPKAPWVAADGQVEDHADEWNAANRTNLSVLRYKPITIDGVIVPSPQRVALPGVPAGWGATMQFAENDIQGNMGMYKAALGAPSAETSGKAILAKQRESDSSTFHFVDNLSHSLIHLGRILVDLIPKIMDTAHIARILGEDGSNEAVKLNPEQSEAMRQVRTNEGIKKIYNLGVGKYDVTVTTGPSYTTKRAEAAEGMVNVIQTNPELMNVAGDLLFKNLDWPGADEMSKRMQKMLPPQLQEQDENDPATVINQLRSQLEEQNMAMEQMQGEMQKASEQLQTEAQKVEQGKQQLQALDSKVMEAGNKVEMQKEGIKLQEEKALIKLEQKSLAIDKALSELELMREKLKCDMDKAQHAQGMAQKEQTISQRETDVVNNVSQPMMIALENIAQQTAQVAAQSDANVANTAQMMALAIDRMSQALTAPKKLVRDSDGRPTGVVTG